MKVVCPKCGGVIPLADVSIETGLAKCVACDEVFGIVGQVPGASAMPAAGPKPQVPMPRAFALSREPGAIVLTRRWFSAQTIALLIFATFWDGFLVFWYSMATVSGAPLVAFLFPLIHVAVGVGVTWTTVAQLFNKTEFRVGSGRVAVRHYPVPGWKGQSVPVGDIEQLYCVETISRGRNGVSCSYAVHVLTKSNQRLKLVHGLEARDHALFIESEIEQLLGIADWPVAGEVRAV